MKSKLFRIALGLVLVSIIVAGVIGVIFWKGSRQTADVDSLKLFKEVLFTVKKQYVEEVDTKKLLQSAIQGMLASLDPHSDYMPPDSFKEMRVQMTGSFGGIGIEISIKDNKLIVISPIEDTPAYRAGIKAYDHIWKIDNKLTKGMSITDAVKLMRGEKGTRVTLTILRNGSAKPYVFPLIRDIIKTKSLRSRTLVPGFGYIRIAHFQETTGPEFTKALKTLHEQNNGKLRGLVIDLRNNPGGLLNSVVEVADHFVGEGFNNGLIVYTEGRDPNSRMKLTSRIGEKEPHYPIVVLINGGSASASEIVAGALQDHKRAVIMGTQSFGKGSVQSLIELSDHSGLRLTTARYYTPSGRSIQAKGITPDIIVERLELPTGEKKDSMHIREKDLENHFEDKETSDKKEKLPAYKTDEQIKNDYQLLRALDLLKGWDILKQVIKKTE